MLKEKNIALLRSFNDSFRFGSINIRSLRHLARSQPEKLLRQSEFLSHFGEENLTPHVEAALARAREIHEGRAIDSLIK